ncbi:hypothetical protein WK76_25110 [Burkholderia ubonensis]|nr:hypothetical protein WK76_25110 [Burkholderia ubonensis]
MLSTAGVLRCKFCTRLEKKARFIFEFSVYGIFQHLVTFEFDGLTIGPMLHQHVEKLTSSGWRSNFVDEIIQS